MIGLAREGKSIVEFRRWMQFRATRATAFLFGVRQSDALLGRSESPRIFQAVTLTIWALVEIWRVGNEPECVAAARRSARFCSIFRLSRASMRSMTAARSKPTARPVPTIVPTITRTSALGITRTSVLPACREQCPSVLQCLDEHARVSPHAASSNPPVPRKRASRPAVLTGGSHSNFDCPLLRT